MPYKKDVETAGRTRRLKVEETLQLMGSKKKMRTRRLKVEETLQLMGSKKKIWMVRSFWENRGILGHHSRMTCLKKQESDLALQEGCRDSREDQTFEGGGDTTTHGEQEEDMDGEGCRDSREDQTFEGGGDTTTHGEQEEDMDGEEFLGEQGGIGASFSDDMFEETKSPTLPYKKDVETAAKRAWTCQSQGWSWHGEGATNGCNT